MGAPYSGYQSCLRKTVGLRTECVPRSRIQTIVRFDDARAEVEYRVAFQALLTSAHSSASSQAADSLVAQRRAAELDGIRKTVGASAGGGGASGGLKPLRLCRPGSIATRDKESDEEPSFAPFLP